MEILPFTGYYISILSIAIILDIICPFLRINSYFAFNIKQIINKFQIWRIFTNLLVKSNRQINIGILFDFLFLNYYIYKIEHEEKIKKKYSTFIMTIIILCILNVLVSFVFYFIFDKTESRSLVKELLYSFIVVSSYKNPNNEIIIFYISIKNKFFPMAAFFFNASFIWSKDIRDLQKPVIGFINGYLFCLIVEKFEINITPNIIKKLFKEQNIENIDKNDSENEILVNKKNKETIFNINLIDTIKPQYVIRLTIINKKIENIGRKNVKFTVEHFNVNCNANKTKNTIKLKNIKKELTESLNLYGGVKRNNIKENNYIEKNKNFEIKLNSLIEENKVELDLQNKYNQSIIEKNDMQNKIEDIINNNKNIINKIENIEQKTNILIFQKDDIKIVKIEAKGDLKNLLKFVYLRYLLLKKKKTTLIYIGEYFNIYLNKANKLKESGKKKEFLEKKYLRDIILGKMSNIKYLAHKYFLRFYYKGLISLIKHKIDTNEIIDIKYIQKENNKEIQQEQKFLEENSNDKIEKKEQEQKDAGKKNDEKTVDAQKEGDKKIDEKEEISDNVAARRKQSRNIRKLLHKKNEERKKILQQALYKFELNGIINKFIDKVRRINKPEKSPEKEVINNGVIPEKIKTEKKEETEEGKNKKNLDLFKLKLLEVIINKKDRKNAIALKAILEKWNLIVKIDSLSEYDKRKKKKKKKKKEHKIENKIEIKENEEKKEENN